MNFNKSLTLQSLLLLAISLGAHAQVESCAQYGNDPKNFQGQKCWMFNYFTSNIWKYNQAQKVDANFHFNISQGDIASFFKYDQGENNFYLDIDNIAWGSYWYPCKVGGIANRYRTGTAPISANLNWNKLTQMSKRDLFNLSPAEKLDIFIGNKDFAIAKWELQHRGPERPNHNDDGFCGYCNGSRVAGALLPEPAHNIIVSSSIDPSISVEFSLSDLKAIAAGSYMHPRFYLGIGVPDVAGQNDPNPGLFDVMLRLYLSKYKMPFFIDADPGKDIYNETVLGYDRRIISTRSLTNQEAALYPDAATAVKVKTVIYLQDELTIAQSNSPTLPIMADKQKALATASTAATYEHWVHPFSYDYYLYVDGNRNIVNGSWLSTPVDFLWAANGSGNDENNEFANNPGNKNLKFDPILYLFKLSCSKPGEAINAQPPPIDSKLLNTDRQFQSPPANFNVRQNTQKGNAN